MKIADHWLRLFVDPSSAQPETFRLVTRRDVQWGTPVFRAPALPTPSQLNRELPFTENFRPRFSRGR
jgi:hypothetical protein